MTSCKAVQHSDQMVCECGNVWDMNDPDPPHCNPPKKPEQQVEQQPPALTVWYGSMPESNGKSNYTAILKRKGETELDGIEDGFTIARSEYPDRVRYEADRVRHLIGELAEEPWILDYDADKHSGHTAPPAAPDVSGLAEYQRIDAVQGGDT